jgi:hypothetical protein
MVLVSSFKFLAIKFACSCYRNTVRARAQAAAAAAGGRGRRRVLRTRDTLTPSRSDGHVELSDNLPVNFKLNFKLNTRNCGLRLPLARAPQHSEPSPGS